MSEYRGEGIESDGVGSIHVVQEEDAHDALSRMHNKVFVLQEAHQSAADLEVILFGEELMKCARDRFQCLRACVFFR
jgi:hypothetical protein